MTTADDSTKNVPFSVDNEHEFNAVINNPVTMDVAFHVSSEVSRKLFLKECHQKPVDKEVEFITRFGFPIHYNQY